MPYSWYAIHGGERRWGRGRAADDAVHSDHSKRASYDFLIRKIPWDFFNQTFPISANPHTTTTRKCQEYLETIPEARPALPNTSRFLRAYISLRASRAGPRYFRGSNS